MPLHENPDRPVDYDEHLNKLKLEKESDPDYFFSIRTDLRQMALGGDAGGIRQDAYPGWNDEDFRALLKDLGEDDV